MRIKFGICALAAMAGMYALASPASAQSSQISGAINEKNLVTLAHNTRSEANAANDRGAMSGNVVFGGEVILRRPVASEKAFEGVIANLHNPKSAIFHHWLTNAEIGERYGSSDADIARIGTWMGAHGLHVTSVNSDHTFISFTGPIRGVEEAFHTQIHNLNVDGQNHFANMSDPKVPAAFGSIVAGVLSLNDFQPHPALVKRFVPTKGKKPNYSLQSGCFPASPTNHGASFTDECEFVTPADLATIYDMKPAFNSGVTGAGQTVVVVEDTNVYKVADWNIFRAVMGLSGYTQASFTQVHPTGSAACANPGVNGDDGEAILDAEYASASAPNAAIVLASCTDTGTTNAGFGGLKAIQNMIAQANPPKIFSMSYGECETANGVTANAAYNSTFQTAAAEGVSIYVSSGDESATSCDANRANASHGIGVSGFMSSPYDISVGGTDFTDNTNPGNANQWKTYWNASNGTGYGSAKSYIPEQPWNDSCASEIMSSFYSGSTVTYGTSGFCNSSFGEADFLSTGSGSGGPSGCATGTVTTSGVVSGTCAGWAKPSYQAGFAGIVPDGVRDTPDVSLFAANGVWGHYYPFCDSDPADAPVAGDKGGCQSADPANWAGAGGTSFASPIWAGIQALINQKTAQSWGNTNTQYYAIAAAEYGASGNANCNSNGGSGVGCAFHDITAGDFNVNCKGLRSGSSTVLHNCYLPSGTNGVSSYSGTNTPAGYIAAPSAYDPMFKSATGWDFTTGIGTPDVNNLINAFPNQVASVTKKH